MSQLPRFSAICLELQIALNLNTHTHTYTHTLFKQISFERFRSFGARFAKRLFDQLAGAHSERLQLFVIEADSVE